MSELLSTIVREHGPQHVPSELSFVKFNTAGSAKRATPKVLFFCFYGDESRPSLVLKTVRSARDNNAVEQGFHDLKALSAFLPYAFPKPLWNGTVDGIAWSVESAVAGVRPSSSDIQRIVERYIEFQKSASRAKKTAPAKEVAQRLIGGLDAADKADAEALMMRLGISGDVTLLPQHGDLTHDNVLVGTSEVYFVDADRYMPEGIAGFDLCHFFSRLPRQVDVAGYLRSYRQAIGLERDWSKTDLFLWVVQERALKRVQGGTTSGNIARSFETAEKYFGL